MNRIMIIGNLTKDPERRTLDNDKVVCNFTVAVNRKAQSDHPEADYFRVTAWDRLAEIADKYLSKGKKVCVIGPARANAWLDRDGNAAASIEVTAHELELLTPRDRREGEDNAER